METHHSGPLWDRLAWAQPRVLPARLGEEAIGASSRAEGRGWPGEEQGEERLRIYAASFLPVAGSRARGGH